MYKIIMRKQVSTDNDNMGKLWGLGELGGLWRMGGYEQQACVSGA